MDNQAIGLLPMLLFMFLDNYFSYLVSFIICLVFFFASIVIFSLLRKDKVYQFMLIPAAATFSLYTLFLPTKLHSVLAEYSPLITEILLVVVLAIMGFTKRLVLRRIRDSKHPMYKRSMFRTTLNEFYFLVQLVQGLYTLHLFGILIYTTMPETMKDLRLEHFLYRELGLIIGLAVIVYEQIRISFMHGSLKKEMWLPVLDEGGKVVGCIARSVSRSLPKKYYHPVVRVALMYDGKLYLTKRNKTDYVSPDTLDYPFFSYVLFKHSIEATVKDAIGDLAKDKRVVPRSLIKYTYEDDKVKHLVYLHVVCLRTQDQMDKCKMKGAKLWTTKQIEEDLGKGVFSTYFEQEFPYLKNTVLFAENFCCGDPQDGGNKKKAQGA